MIVVVGSDGVVVCYKFFGFGFCCYDLVGFYC